MISTDKIKENLRIQFISRKFIGNAVEVTVFGVKFRGVNEDGSLIVRLPYGSTRRGTTGDVKGRML